MKTAISIPDKVFEPAEHLAARLGISRSQLYTQALAVYIAEHKLDDITKRLNDVYADLDSSFDPGLERLQTASLPKGKW